jgi:hypothetical protein
MKNNSLFFQKKKSLNFFYSLINSDFLILEKKNKLKKNRFLKSNLKLLNNKKNSFSLLNYFELLKTLKQFVRILQFFKNTKNPLLLMDFNNKQFLKISDLFFQKHNFMLPIEFKKNASFSSQKSPFVLFLDKNFLNNKNTLKKLVYANIFIIIQINSFVTNLNSSSYKIFNSFNTIKKLVFLMVLLKKIYIKKSEKKYAFNF